MTDQFAGDPPSALVAQWGREAAIRSGAATSRRALDVAAGRGRHAVLLAGLGWRVFAVDANIDALHTARDRAALGGFPIRAWCADLVVSGLPRAAFELVVVTRYLQRSLFDPIRDALVPQGIVIYETFTVNQRALGSGPTSPDHLLRPGELLARFDGFDVLWYEEVSAPDAVARLVARRP